MFQKNITLCFVLRIFLSGIQFYTGIFSFSILKMVVACNSQNTHV